MVEDSIIAKFEFLSNINTRYGFDIVSGSNENNISLENGQNTEFKIVLSNVDSCCIKINDSINFTIERPISKKIQRGENIVQISSINDNGKHTSKLIMYDCQKKDTLSQLNILSYPKVDVNMYVYCIYDSKNNCYDFSSNINKGNYKTEIKQMLSQAVVNLNEFEIEAIDIEFDKNHNGALDLFDDKDSTEIDMIRNYTYPYAISHSLALFNVDIQRTYKIRDTIAVNSSYLIFSSYNDPKIKEVNRYFYYYDKDTLRQTVTIKRISGDTLFIYEQLNRTLYPNDYVWRPINGLSSNPQLISLTNNADITMAHEKLHKLGLHDLELNNQINLMNVQNKNIMIYKGTNFRKTELRNRPLLIRNKQGKTEKQWDAIIRTKKE